MVEWVTVKEAAALSHYHPEHIRELIREGQIAAEKKGNAWWVDRKSLLTFLKGAKQSPDRRWGPRGG